MIWRELEIDQKRHLTQMAGTVAIVLMVYTVVAAQTIDRSDGHSVLGGVQEFLKDPSGEIVGAMLDDGTALHWPPHASQQVTQVVKRGDWIEAIGRLTTDAQRDTHVEVRRITNLATDVSLDIGRPQGLRGKEDTLAPGTPSNHNAWRTIQGKIVRFTATPEGQIEGAELSDGSIIHWPPQNRIAITRLVKVGDEVRITGRLEGTGQDERRLEVSKLTDLTTGTSLDYGNAPRQRVAAKPVNDRTELDRRLDALQKQLNEIQREIDQLRETNL